MPGPTAEPPKDARRAADDVRRATGELRDSLRQATEEALEAARASRQVAGLSAAVAATTRDAVRQAVDEARRAIQDIRVEVRVDRMTREESRQQTRERLLDAAAEVFNRLGYHGASLEAVAEAAGYTKGAVYSNFATKGELFAALLDRSTHERHAERVEALTDLSLEQMADAVVDLLRRQAREGATWDLLQVEFWLAAMRDPALRARLSQGSDELYRDWGRLLDRKLAEAGVDAPFSGTELSHLVEALGSGLILQISLGPDAVDPSLFGRAVRRLAGLPDHEPEPSPGDGEPG